MSAILTKTRRHMVGIVTSAAMDKSIVVTVPRIIKHPIYGKEFLRHKKFMAHDESNMCSLGDKVELKPCRPVSKQKHFEAIRVLEPKAGGEGFDVHRLPALTRREKRKYLIPNMTVDE